MRGWVLLGVCALCACDATIGEMDDIYSHGADHRILCSLSLDAKNLVSDDAISIGLDRAQVDDTVLHLYTHRPNGSVDESTIEQVIAGAADRAMDFVTYRELLDGAKTHGLALSFDDHDFAGWHDLRPMFDRYGAKVTFFVSAFHTLTDEEVGFARDLAADGHDIEYHSTNHLNAEEYSKANGVDAYIADEILPDLALIRAAGFDPHVFAYPFGARTPATDAALLQVFPLVRAIQYTCPY